MTQAVEDRECTENCKSVNHGDIISASLTKRCVPEADLWCFIKYVCCCCESVKDSSGRTALHVAASCGKTEIIQRLCKHKHINLNARDLESGYTPLHRSIFYGKIDAAVSLMKLGANASLTDFDGLTVFEHAMYDQKSRMTAEDGEIYVWGSNTNYTLGPQQARSVPEIMDIFHKENPNVHIKQVCLSRFHCVMVSADGRVFSCGHGQGGRLGLSTEHAVLIPKAVKFTSGNQCANVICVEASIAENHSVFLTDAGNIWTCGLNTHKVLGLAPPPTQLLSPRPLHHFSHPIDGVLAMKYHTVAWCSTAIYSWGLHAGQLGHDRSDEKYVITPKQIPNFCSSNSEIVMVAGSTGATAFVTSAGDIYVLHEYKCRKVAGKQLNVIQLRIIGGKLDVAVDNCVSSDCDTLKVCILTGEGRVLMWQENDQQLLRCIFSVSRLIIVKQISLNTHNLLFVTKDGEAFEGAVKERRKRNLENATNVSATKSSFHKFLEKDDCRMVKVTKIPKIHRAVFIESDLEAKNFAVIQVNPRHFLTSVPDILPSTIHRDMSKLLEEADQYDQIHDLIFIIDGKSFPAHRFVCSAGNLESLKLELDSSETYKINMPSVHPEIFQQLLLYVYTGSCDLVVCQKCPSHLEEICRKMKHASSGGPGKTKDPVRMLQECAKKVGLKPLQKLLEDFYYHDGYIKCRSGKVHLPKRTIKFDRNSCPQLCDVVIKTKNEKELKAHKCILTARMEYFGNLFSLRWNEATPAHQIFLPYSYTVVERLLEFLYTDELVSIENEDIENVFSLLVLADEYFIERLKQICEYVLSTHITLKNVSQIFEFSHMYNANQLSACCMEFICFNLSAVLESRCLEDVEESLLKKLTEYYCEWNPIMQQRVITPYSTAPADDTVLEIAKSYPCTAGENDSETKHAKNASKRKSKSHRNSVTCKSVDSDKENVIKENDTASVVVSSEEVVERKHRETPVRIQAINSALKQLDVEPMITDYTPLPSSDFVSLSNFPELGSPPKSGACSKSPRSSEKFESKSKATKLSQKQRKRLSSESSSKVTSAELSESPKNPWKLCTEISAESPPIAETNISAIITAEKKQKENLSKMMSKPLVYTQKEDKAIEELQKFYNVERVFDEIIVIDRVHVRLVGSPVWIQKHK